MLNKKIVKYIQSLSHKKLRDEHAQFIAETPKVVSEFLSAKIFKCSILCADKTWILENKSLLKNILPDSIFEVDEHLLQQISLLKTPNRVVAVFEKKLSNKSPEIENKLSLMLDDIRDPGNLGTIIRIADWFDIKNIICSENCADCYNPKVVQATMGSLARTNVFYTSLNSFIELNKNIKIYAAALSGMPLSKIKNINEGIILIGNESRGISKELLNMASQKITIPKYGNAESLNAAVATGIILSHVRTAY
jgi:TrmH family RNA methyltransferase